MWVVNAANQSYKTFSVCFSQIFPLGVGGGQNKAKMRVLFNFYHQEIKMGTEHVIKTPCHVKKIILKKHSVTH